MNIKMKVATFLSSYDLQKMSLFKKVFNWNENVTQQQVNKLLIQES
jgi:hypothetical protein